MKLQIFMKSVLLAVISLDSALKKDEIIICKCFKRVVYFE